MLEARVLHSLKNLLPIGQVFTDRAALVAYEVDAGMDKGRPEGVVFPRNIEEVVRIVRWAAEQHVPLIARGAGTGLSGGAVADRGGLIVEFVHMQRILDIDVQGRSALVEPALINLRLDERVKKEGLYFPPDPASQRASTLGGNVAENSGGPHCFKYGVTTNYVTGMQLVLADGRTVHLGGRALDYPEYDLCGLVTGSEGLLGLITAINLRLLRNPPGVKTLLAIFDSVEQAGIAVSAIIAAGLVPATMEMMDQRIINIIEPFAHANLPLDAGAVLIVDVDGYPASLNAQVDELIAILELHGGYDMRVARDEEERYKIWLARKSAAGAIARVAPAYNTVDITVPRSRLTEMLSEVNQICDRYNVRAGHVFHAGDGNLHPLILIPDPADPELMQRVHAAGWEMVKRSVEMGGSLTGEHGVGIEKRQYMLLMHTAAELMAMWDVKNVFDPDCLLNPGKIFPVPSKDETGPYAGYIVDRPAIPTLPASFRTVPFLPSTSEEAAQGLLALADARQQIVISGTAEPLQSEHPQLSTHALSGIQVYAPADLTITVAAGTLLTDIQTFLSHEGMQLAVASPWPAATIGGLVAANVNAPQRMRYGALRDIVLCATVALVDGRVIRTGRPLVKNVAGFDMTKVFIGAYGTLGLLTDISLKISARPRSRRTLLLPIDDLHTGLTWSTQLLKIALNASAIVLCYGYQTPGIPQSKYLLAYTAEGMAEDVQAELAQVRQTFQHLAVPTAYETETVTGTEIWAELLGTATQPSVMLRAGMHGHHLSTYVQDQASLLHDGPFVIDVANGLIYARRQFSTVEEACRWSEALRQPALSNEGYAIIMDQPEKWQNQLERWGYRPDALHIMQRLKARWDPNGILNNGTFVVDKPEYPSTVTLLKGNFHSGW